MDNVIQQLTPEQEKELNEFYLSQLAVGRSIEPINHAKVEEIITKFYKRLDKPAPKFIYGLSPMGCIVAAQDIQNENGEVTKYDDINTVKIDKGVIDTMCSVRYCGQQWIAWSSFYSFAERIGVKYDPADSELLAEWVEEGKHLHWWFPFDEVVFVSERPVHLAINAAGNLHDETQMAIRYADGWGLYSLNGVTVPEYLVKTDAEALSIEFFKNEKNADVKAEFVRKFGVERMLDMGKKVDGFENYDQEENPWWWKSEYELWDMAAVFIGLEYQPFLKMRNQTTDIWHFEAVSPACRTIGDAIKERFGGRDMKIADIS
jgi:hypothetical protein